MPLLYSFIYSFISVWTCVYLHLDYIPDSIIYFIGQIVPISHWELFYIDSCVSLTSPSFCLLSSLIFDNTDAVGSSFPCLSHPSVISPRSSGGSYWRMIFRKQDLDSRLYRNLVYDKMVFKRRIMIYLIVLVSHIITKKS